MLQASARDDVAGFAERLDDGIVRVALVAGLFENALAREARRVFRQHAVGIDGERIVVSMPRSRSAFWFAIQML